MLSREDRRMERDDREAAAAAGSPKRRMTLSAALKWAWAEELPKEPAHSGPEGFASAWGAIERYGELMTVVDRDPNRYGCIPFDEAGFPHADALKLAAAVEELDGLVIDAPEDWDPMPELAAIDPDLARAARADAVRKATREGEGGERVFAVRPSVLAIRHAILGIVPDWQVEALPAVEYERYSNGRPRWFVRREVSVDVGTDANGAPTFMTETVEVDGWSSRQRRPMKGAYQKPYFDPDPVPALVARAEYEVFCAAMAWLAEAIGDRLETIDIAPIEWPARPWEEGGDSLASDAKRGRSKVLPDLKAEARRKNEAKIPIKTRCKPASKNICSPA
jgi:hypothetical protein